MNRISESDWKLAMQAGLEDFVDVINGDRCDDAYEGQPGVIEAARKLPTLHKALLKAHKPARDGVLTAYQASRRDSNTTEVLLAAAEAQYKAWQVAWGLACEVGKMNPSELTLFDYIREAKPKALPEKAPDTNADASTVLPARKVG